MFERKHHQRIQQVLEILDGAVLHEHCCYFGGGTAIVLRCTVAALVSVVWLFQMSEPNIRHFSPCIQYPEVSLTVFGLESVRLEDCGD